MANSDEWLRFAPKPRTLKPGERYHVFLSYRSVNRIWVLNLYDVLHHQGFEVFLDQVVLTGGDELIRVLEDGLSLERARQQASRVQKIVGTAPRQGDYWMTATVGELLLMQTNYRDAASVYSAAVAMARTEIASHETTWRQARRLMETLNPSAEQRALVRDAFAHLPDHPGS